MRTVPTPTDDSQNSGAFRSTGLPDELTIEQREFMDSLPADPPMTDAEIDALCEAEAHRKIDVAFADLRDAIAIAFDVAENLVA